MQFIEIAHAEEATLTSETAVADQGLLASLGINTSTFIWQTVNFLLIMVVLWFLILKPLTKKMAERQKMIDDSLENAKRVQENLIKSESQYQARIDEAKVEANKIIEKATNEAIQSGDQMRAKAKDEIEGLVEQAKKNIRIEKEDMVADLKKETVDLVVTVVEKVLAEKMNSAKDAEMISEMVAKIK